MQDFDHQPYDLEDQKLLPGRFGALSGGNVDAQLFGDDQNHPELPKLQLLGSLIKAPSTEPRPPIV